MMALHYQGIVEEAAARKLDERTEITWLETRDIVQTIAQFIGKQVKATAKILGYDLATEKSLLPEG